MPDVQEAEELRRIGARQQRLGLLQRLARVVGVIVIAGAHAVLQGDLAYRIEQLGDPIHVGAPLRKPADRDQVRCAEALHDLAHPAQAVEVATDHVVDARELQAGLLDEPGEEAGAGKPQQQLVERREPVVPGLRDVGHPRPRPPGAVRPREICGLRPPQVAHAGEFDVHGAMSIVNEPVAPGNRCGGYPSVYTDASGNAEANENQ